MSPGDLTEEPRTKARRLGRPGRADVSGEDGRPRRPMAVGGPWARSVLSLLGLAALVCWGVWWANSVRADRLVGGKHTWIPILPFLAGDFVHNVDPPARVWVAGGDPYQDTPMTACYPYPPVVPRLFAWVGLLSPRTAMIAWLVALTAIATTGARACWSARRELGLGEVPLPIVLAAVLYSTPVLYALERGNVDLIVLLAVLVALGLMRTRAAAGEAMAGLVLAVASWSKLYPGLLVLGLLALRRRRVLAAYAVAGGVIGMLSLPDLPRFLRNNRTMVGIFTNGPRGVVLPLQHSLTDCWRHLWVGTPLRGLARIPGGLATLGLLLPLVLWISLRVSRCPDRARLAYPYLMWVLALATFVPPIANDYNLFFLPLAALAVWDRRDSACVHAMMAPMLLWWQPLALPIDGRVLLVFKLTGLVAVAFSLAGRATGAGQQECGSGSVLAARVEARCGRPSTRRSSAAASSGA
jgi:hypothetical protein